MASLIRKRTSCRLCGGWDLEPVVTLAPVPIATPNVGVDEGGNDAEAIKTTMAPLDLYQCRGCGHLQLLDVVDPSLQYDNYLYTTSVSQGLAEHFAETAAAVMAESGAPRGRPGGRDGQQ